MRRKIKKPAVNNVGQIARIGRFLAIEDAVNIEKDYSYPPHDSKSVLIARKQNKRRSFSASAQARR